MRPPGRRQVMKTAPTSRLVRPERAREKVHTYTTLTCVVTHLSHTCTHLHTSHTYSYTPFTHKYTPTHILHTYISTHLHTFHTQLHTFTSLKHILLTHKYTPTYYISLPQTWKQHFPDVYIGTSTHTYLGNHLHS